MANFNFDAATVEPSAPSGPIPAGNYLAQVIESDLKPLKSGNGMAIALTFQILDGEYKNRRVWTNLNVQHVKPEVQKIGQQQLSTLCRAVNVMQLKDTAQLHNKPVVIRVKIRVDEQYGDRNEVNGYEAVGSSAPQAAPAYAASAAQPSKKAPWEQ